MKKLLFSALALLPALIVTPVPVVKAGQNYPDPCSYSNQTNQFTSVLCAGLIEHFAFQEDSDSPRFGSYMTYFLEPEASNVGRIAEIASGLDGSYSLDLESSSSQRLWTNGALPTQNSTIALWFKTESLPASVGQKMTIISANTTNAPGPEVYVERTSIDGGGDAKVCYTNYEDETNTQLIVCSATDSVTNAVAYHVAVGESQYHTGKSRLFLSLNGGTLQTTSAAYWTRVGVGIITVGAKRSAFANYSHSQYFDGALDQLVFYGRALTTAEISLLYNGPNGRVYPFYTD